VHEYPASEWQLAVGTSGTARSLRDIMEQNGWSGGEITLRGMKRLRDELIACGHTRDIRILGLKDDRAPVLPGGLAIMIAIFESLAIEQMIVTDGALRDGVLYDLLGRQREKDMRDSTVTQFKRRYHVDVPQAQRVAALAERLFRMVSADALDEDMLKRVLWAARLHEIGLTIAHTAYHKHSAYILTNADMPGFSRREQSVLAAIVLGHRGDMGKMVKEVTDPALWPAVLSLRLAALFYRSRNELDINAVHGLTQTMNGYALTVGKDWLAANPLTTAAFRQEIAQWKAIGVALELRGD
jgi:exopolyphosphatase/guanosine-5'-triphosphate,3'-diphosphate pyrophosphatase